MKLIVVVGLVLVVGCLDSTSASGNEGAGDGAGDGSGAGGVTTGEGAGGFRTLAMLTAGVWQPDSS